MRVYCVVDMAGAFDGITMPKEVSTVHQHILVPTDITVESSEDLNKLLDSDPERFKNHRWLPVSEKIQPRGPIAKVQYSIKFGWGNEKKNENDEEDTA